MLQVKLLEMPLTELEDSINAELDDNPALESENPDDMLNENVANDDSPADDEYDNSSDEDAYEAESEKKKEKTNWTRHWKASEKTTRCPTTIQTDTTIRTALTTKKWFTATPPLSMIS